MSLKKHLLTAIKSTNGQGAMAAGTVAVLLCALTINGTA